MAIFQKRNISCTFCYSDANRVVVQGRGAASAFSARECSVVLRDPVGDGGTAGVAPGVRRPAGVGDADDGRRGRNGGAGTGTAGPPARVCEPAKGRARPPRLPRGTHWRPGLPRLEGAAGDS